MSGGKKKSTLTMRGVTVSHDELTYVQFKRDGHTVTIQKDDTSSKSEPIGFRPPKQEQQ